MIDKIAALQKLALGTSMPLKREQVHAKNPFQFNIKVPLPGEPDFKYLEDKVNKKDLISKGQRNPLYRKASTISMMPRTQNPIKNRSGFWDRARVPLHNQ